MNGESPEDKVEELEYELEQCQSELEVLQCEFYEMQSKLEDLENQRPVRQVIESIRNQSMSYGLNLKDYQIVEKVCDEITDVLV